MDKNYDVIIIGAGPSGIFCAYELNEKLYEAKLVYYTPTFDDKVRVFCTNPSGEVSTEYYENGLAVVNGHAYKSKDKKTHNTNFALLVSKNFTEPFREAHKVTPGIASDEPLLYGVEVKFYSNKVLVNTEFYQRAALHGRRRAHYQRTDAGIRKRPLHSPRHIKDIWRAAGRRQGR